MLKEIADHRIKSRNHNDLIIDIDKNQTWTDEELEILTTSFFQSLDTHAVELFNAWTDKSDYCSLKCTIHHKKGKSAIGACNDLVVFAKFLNFSIISR